MSAHQGFSASFVQRQQSAPADPTKCLRQAKTPTVKPPLWETMRYSEPQILVQVQVKTDLRSHPLTTDILYIITLRQPGLHVAV